MKLIILLFILLCINNVSANSTDIITPYHGYEGNLLITNEGTLIYSIFTFDGDYVGTIKPSESIYINNSYNYCIYGNYDEFRDLTDVNKIKSIVVECIENEESFTDWSDIFAEKGYDVEPYNSRTAILKIKFDISLLQMGHNCIKKH